MPSYPLTAEAQRENATALAAALGLDLCEATKLLDLTVVITVNRADTVAAAFALDIAELLSRTVRTVSIDTIQAIPAAELVIGDARPRSEGRKIFLSVDDGNSTLSRVATQQKTCQPIHGLWRIIVACYACATMLDCALDRELPFGLKDPLVLSFDALGVDRRDLDKPVDIGHAYLAGAGAIGNGLLWAARHLDLRGRLEIVDDDHVDSGNLNRQVWFGTEDVGQKKVDRLVLNAQPFFPKLALIPRPQRLQDLSEKSAAPWLRRLLVAVDSRRARRQLQNELPGEVFDASTTDIREVVVHYHRQPTTQACLSCIYEPDEEELSREQHVADHLGVSVEAVRSERIGVAEAAVITKRFPALADVDLIGTAYDTLFKRLCGEGLLRTAGGRRVVAPFAFVSVLAGALLALELVRRLGSGNSDRTFNYWRVSAWHRPLSRRRVLRPSQPGCQFCSSETLQHVNSQLWQA
jgi:molybdopterin/thiamine biosynthesis adenylyltransferase